MHYRTPDIIFATSGMPAPSVEEVRFEARELLQRKGWGLPLIFALHQIRNPYWREAIARCLMDKWMEMVRNRDEQVFYCDSNGNWCYCWLEAESDFNSVIRQSTNEQTEAEQNSSPATHTTNMQPIEHKTMNNYSQTNIGTQNNNCVIYNAPVYNYYGQAPSDEADATNSTTPPDPLLKGEKGEKGGEADEVNLFTKQAQREGKEPEIIAALQRSFVGRNDKARALVEEVREWQKEGYIDPHYNARVMYEQLNRIITLPFEYGGFRKYYNE